MQGWPVSTSEFSGNNPQTDLHQLSLESFASVNLLCVDWSDGVLCHSCLLIKLLVHTSSSRRYFSSFTVLMILVSPTPSLRMVQFLCRLLSLQSFELRPNVSTVLAPGQNAPRMFHRPRQNWGIFTEFFLRATLHMAHDGSDDTAKQHYCVFDQSV